MKPSPITALLAAASLASARRVTHMSTSSRDAIRHSKRNDYTSPTWCGPVIKSQNMKTVEATWTVPEATIPEGGDPNLEYWFSHWVGIDGDGDCNVIWQGGTENHLVNGESRTFTWYEWYPSDLVELDLAVNPGDTVYVKITANTATDGEMYMENQSTGESGTWQASSENGPLCLATAEFIAEDPGGPDNPQPFPAFNSFDFHGCKASDADGNQYTLNDADNWSIVHGDQRLCHADITSESDVTMNYL